MDDTQNMQGMQEMVVHTPTYAICESIDRSATLAQDVFFFFNDPATAELSPFPLHAALPISGRVPPRPGPPPGGGWRRSPATCSACTAVSPGRATSGVP